MTTSRAEFGLLRGLLKCIENDRGLQRQVIASGTHLSRTFGMTITEIEAEGVRVDRKIDLRLSGSSEAANAKAVGRGLPRFSDALAELKPDIVVLLGDRFEL